MEDIVRMLIVDDDRLIRGFFREIFPDRHVVIETAESGQQALEKIQATPFQIVITDLKMPGVDGRQLLRDIQQASPQTVVIIMTGQGSIKDTVDVMKQGAFDVVAKPFRLEEMRIVIEKALKHHRLRNHNEELKQKLATSEKLAVIGRLAAGVAHELNNPLDGVLRFVNLSLDRLPAEHAAIHEYLLEARTGLNRMADIVRSLLQFSRNIVLENEPREISEMIREALSQLQHVREPEKLDVRTSVVTESLKAPAGLFQVFTNLIKNALDAMPPDDVGKLEIAAIEENGETVIRFTDNGSGIQESDRERIFEPFFTTKEVGKGTGLGLSICARIVEKFRGTLHLESELGVGSTFVVRFPTVN